MRIARLDILDEDCREGHRKNEESLVDIVAVHGLNEDHINAWLDRSSSGNEILWFRDLLPKTIRVARVLSVDYDAHLSMFYGNGSVGNIQREAETLVAQLQADRSMEGCPQRPIIFVCHGLGGVLVKKALAHSSTRTNRNLEHLYSIFTSTFAILFFGTPHNGADPSRWVIPTYVSDNQNYDGNTTYHAAEKDSEALQMVTDHFTPLMKQFHIFFFWEQIPTDFGYKIGFVVDESSAAPIIDNTERSGIHATHDQMAKFSGPSDSSYRMVIEALVRYCHDAPQIIARRWKQASELLSRARLNEASELTGTGFDVHNNNRPFEFQHSEVSRNKHFYPPQALSSIFTGREDMSDLVEKSLLSEDDKVLSFSRKQRRYIIYGVGGSGKTQFCCKFAEDHRDRFWAIFTIDATSIDTAKHSYEDIGKIGGLEGTQDAGKHWLSHLEEPWLLIINNADDPSINLQSLFPKGDRGYILVTTRNPDSRIHQTVGSVEFKGLKEREALLLLLKAADIRSPWDASTEESGNKITTTLGHLALALINAGSLILQKICDLTNYLDFYDQYRRELSLRHRSLKATDSNTYLLPRTWGMSLEYLKKKGTNASRDATQILNIVAFFHFERIPVAIFTRAIRNKTDTIYNATNKPLTERFMNMIWSRLQPPFLLPDFLRQEKLNEYDVRSALRELQSFSLIFYDGKDSFSLHPVVHAWARDRLSPGGQALWMNIARNTLAESILLPPGDGGEIHERFRRDILPHLDRCLATCPIEIPDFEANFGGIKLPFTVLLQYTLLVNFREQVLMAAKFGYVYLERGYFNQAAILLAMVKDALIQSRGIKDELTMKAMLALAATYWGLGRLNEAIVLQNTVVEARKTVLGPEHHETLSAMDQLGRSYWLNGQYHEALELQTLTSERMKVVLGKDHAETLAAMDNLGVTLGSWHRYQESMQLHRQVLSFREKALGSVHVDTLTTMNNLAMALFDLKRPGEAKKLMLKVYEERKLKLGKEHPWTLWALCNLAKVESSMGFLKEAEDMLIGGIAAAKRSLGNDHLGVLMGSAELARVYARQKRYKEAETLATETLEQLEVSRGLEHPDTVQALWKIAQLYELQNMVEKALEICKIAVARVDMRLTKQHPLGAIIYSYQETLKNRLETHGHSSSEESRPKFHEIAELPKLKVLRSKTT